MQSWSSTGEDGDYVHRASLPRAICPALNNLQSQNGSTTYYAPINIRQLHADERTGHGDYISTCMDRSTQEWAKNLHNIFNIRFLLTPTTTSNLCVHGR